MNLYSAIVAAIAIWAVARIAQAWIRARRVEGPDETGLAGRDELEQLEARVRNLERIVTDRREALNRSFEDLE